MTINEQIPCFSIQMGEVFLAGLEEILGQPEVEKEFGKSKVRLKRGNDHLLKLDKPLRVEAVEKVLAPIESTYGLASVKGIALRSGRAGFKYLLRELGETLGLTDIDFRLLPVPRKLKAGGEQLATILSQQTDRDVLVSEEGDRFVWQIRNYRTGPCVIDRCVVYLVAGLIQEFYFWASGGRQYRCQMEEGEAGSPGYVVTVDKKSLD